MGLAPICYLFDLTIDLHIIICPFNEFILKLQANLIHVVSLISDWIRFTSGYLILRFKYPIYM